MRKVWGGLLRISSKPINKIAALILSTYTMLWGVWVALPFWDVFSRAELYSYMRILASESAWGSFAILIGSVMLIGINKCSKTAMIGSFMGFIFWMIVSLAYFSGDWRNTGGITSMAISFYFAAMYLNLRVNRTDFDFRI